MLSSIIASAVLAASVVALPLARRQESPASTSNVTYTNSAVWYMQNGIFGACGKLSTDDQLVVGLGIEHYNLSGIVSEHCGSYVVVTNPLNNQSVTARVADASAGNETLSLSIATWRAIKGDETSMKNVTWTFANSSQTDAAIAALPSRSSEIVAEPAYAQPAVVAAAPAPSSSPQSSPSAVAFVAPSATFAAPSSTFTPAPSPTYVAPSPAYVAPTTTYKAPEPTYVAPAPVAQAPSGGQYSGDATYYFQNGIAGACGTVNPDSAYIVAMDSRRYGGNGRQGNCGRQVRITRQSTGKTITATVADACPTCNTGDSLDLSVAAFNSLGAPSEGLFKISWSFV